jgi:hypothetical protein
MMILNFLFKLFGIAVIIKMLAPILQARGFRRSPWLFVAPALLLTYV